MRTRVGLLAAALVALSSALPVGAVVVQSDCNGNGITGSYTENGATLNFQSCILTGAVHTKAWDSGGTIAEVWGNMPDGSNLIYQIAGETVTATASVEQWASWQAFLGSSAAWQAGTHLYGQLKTLGFNPQSNGMIGLEI